MKVKVGTDIINSRDPWHARMQLSIYEQYKDNKYVPVKIDIISH